MAWKSSLFDRFNPGDDDLDEKQKRALMNQGLLGLAAGLLGTPGGFGAGMGAGIQNGLLAMNKGNEQFAENRFKKAKLAAGEGMPAEFASAHQIAIAAGHEPGSEGYKRFMSIKGGDIGRASNAGFQQVKFTDAQGRERLGVMNGRSGRIDLPDGTSFDPQTGAIAATQPEGSAPQAMPAGMQQVQYATDDGSQIPPEEQAVAAEAMRRASAGQQFDIPAVQPQKRPWTDNTPNPYGQAMPGPRLSAIPPGGDMFTGRRKEDEAAAVEAAKANVQLGNLPTELGMRTGADLAAARAKAQITRESELATLDTTRSRDANSALDLLDKAEGLIGQSTGSMAGNLLDKTVGAFGRSTDGATAIAALKTIAGQLTSKMPRMQGPQSDKDVQLYKDMAGDLANPEIPREQRMAALKTIRDLNRKYASAAPRPSGPRRLKFNPATGRIE